MCIRDRDYALRESMAGNGENAMKFVNELLDKVKALSLIHI